MNISTRTKTSRRAGRIAAAIALAGSTMAGVTLTATPAEAISSLRGHITCGASSAGAVVGMWVSTNTGGDGWASWTRYASDPMIASYSKGINSNATTVKVAVGCGGTPQRWGRTYYGEIKVGTGGTTGTKDWICNNYYGSYRCL